MKSSGSYYSRPPFALGLALALGLGLAPLPVRGQSIPNPSFELDTFTNSSGYISNNFPITGWTGSPTNAVGLSPAGGVATYANNGVIPDGKQVAFLQSGPGIVATLSTVITGLTPGQKYTVNFRFNAHTNNTAAAVTPVLKIGVDNLPIVNLSTLAIQLAGSLTAGYRYGAFDFSASGTTALLSLTNDAATTPACAFLVDNFTISPSTNGWSYAAWTGDTDAGVDGTRVTHAYNFGGGSAPNTTINGALFTGYAVANPAIANEFSISGLGSAYGSDDANNINSGGSAVVARRFIYGGNPGYFFIGDLVPGLQYTANFYTCAWETGFRAQTLANGTDRMTINQDNFQNNNGIRISYTYIAPTNGFILLTQTPTLTANTMHTYGFANVETSLNLMPMVGLQPSSQVTTPGSSATLSITAGGARPLTFQWYQNGNTLAGQTTRFLTLANISSANLGGYSVVVSNANGMATSQVANLTFGPIANPSFEADVSQTYPGYASLNTPISGWTVGNLTRSGLNPLPSYPGPFANVGTVPDGNQVAFIQTGGITNWLSTIMNGLTPGQTYTLSFRASARNAQLPVVHAGIDNQYLLDFRLGAATNAYHYIAFDFTPATSSPTLWLTNDGAGDTSALFDNFSVAPSTTHWSFATWTGDADSGVDSSRNYSHAFNFGTTAGTTINGVTFTAAGGANPAGPGFVTAGFPSVYSGDVNTITTAGGGSAAMMKSFIYGGLPESITLTNLVPFVQYEATIYSVGWADTNSRPYGRAATFSVGTDRQTFNQDHFGTDNGIKFTYRYTANASGTVVLTYDATHNAPGTPSTIHTYGFSNSELVSTNAPVFYQQPKNRTISGGADVTFQVAVGGAQPITLQWFKNGVAIPGQNNLLLDLGLVDGSATGGYSCVASNAVGVATSAVAQLEVGLTMINPSFEVDTFTNYPGYIGGAAPNFPITGWTASLPDQTGLNPAAGSPFANNGVIPDGNQVAFIQADGGTLSQDISGLIVGRTYYLKYYENARTGYKAPTLTVQLGTTTVVPAHPVNPGAYVRYVSGPFLATTSTATLTFTKTPGPVAGDSTVLLDSVAMLELAPTPPLFLSQPQGFFVKQGEAQSVSALVQGTLPMSLQWQRNLVNVDGATNDTLSFPAIALTDAGSYRLIATNIYGSATSQVALVQVGLPLTELFNSGVDQAGNLLARGTVDPHYLLINSADSLYPGPDSWTLLDQYPVGGTAYLVNGPNSLWIGPRVNTTGYTGNAQGNYVFRTSFILDSTDPANAQIRGQWAMDNYGTDIQLNGVSLGLTNNAGFTSLSAFTITNAFVAGLNTLDFVITNISAGPSAFRVEMYGVGQALPPTLPFIKSQPTDQLATETQNATFSVVAVGSATLAYQWYYEGSAIPGATDRTLEISPVAFSQAGHYSVVVTNDLGSAASTNALLVVNRNPIANADYVATAMDQPVSIPFASLLYNDTDPDGDPLFLQTTDTNSFASGSLSLGSTSVTYTPPAAFAGLDQFQYYIQDSRGGTAVGMVYVTVGATNFLSLVGAPNYSAGLFTATFSGVPGYPYHVQYSTNLTGPWVLLTNAVADPNGLFEIIDQSSPPAPPRRFYRATYP